MQPLSTEPSPVREYSRLKPHLPPLGPYSYTWPLKPFGRQHPVRAFFGDPRIGKTSTGMSRSFHFGIDIHGKNRTLVYATANGTVLIPKNHGETVLLFADGGRTRFEYWHVKPYVRNGQRVVRNQTVIGHIYCWEHVHFSEWRDGQYVNPLRPGGLGPYRDRTRPYVKEMRVRQAGQTVAPGRVHGRVELVAEAYDPTPTPLPEPYTGNPVAPAELRWRIVGANGAVTDWQTAFDVRHILPAADFASVYAPSTRQNWQEREGRYGFVLADGFDTARLPDGRYAVQIAASDTKANTGMAQFPLTVTNRL